MSKIRTFSVLVRTNCEYSLQVEVKAKNPDQAGEAAMEEADKVPRGEWVQAWAPFEADHEEMEVVSGS